MSRLTTDLHPLLTSDVLNALSKKGIHTALSFIRKKPVVLCQITGLQYDEVLKVQDRILAKYSSPLKRGDKYYDNVIKHCAIISTGIPHMDELLDGGLTTGNIYELCGFDGCGKTQICMTTALSICTSTPHQVLIFDTKYDITGSRLCKMLQSQKVANIPEILDKIKICHPTSACRLLNDLHHLKTALSEVGDKYLGFKVIIIDSLSTLFQVFQNFNEGLSLLNNIVNVMNFLVCEFHLVILVTNFVTCWTPESTLGETEHEEVVNILNVELPALGRYWTHVPGTRIMVRRRGCIDECFLTILKSDSQPVGKSVKVALTESGAC